MTRFQYGPFFLFLSLRWLCEIGSILPAEIRWPPIFLRNRKKQKKKKRPQTKFKNTLVRFPRAIQSPESWNMTGPRMQDGTNSMDNSVISLGF